MTTIVGDEIDVIDDTNEIGCGLPVGRTRQVGDSVGLWIDVSHAAAGWTGRKCGDEVDWNMVHWRSGARVIDSFFFLVDRRAKVALRPCCRSLGENSTRKQTTTVRRHVPQTQYSERQQRRVSQMPNGTSRI